MTYLQSLFPMSKVSCLSGCHLQPLAVVFGHAHGHSPAWQSSVPTIAPRVPATFSRRRGLRRLPGEGSLERRVCLPPLSAEEYLPIIHLVFANLKTWLNGIHHGVSHQHHLPLQQAVLSVQRLPFPARHRGRRHRTLPTQSFTPEPGSILHVGGVGNNRIGKQGLIRSAHAVHERERGGVEDEPHDWRRVVTRHALQLQLRRVRLDQGSSICSCW